MIIEDQSTQTIRQVIANFRYPATAEDDQRNRAFYKQIFDEVCSPLSLQGTIGWRLKPIVLTQLTEDGSGKLTGLSLTWTIDINPHGAIEIISAKDYYGALDNGSVADQGTVVMIHGYATKFSGPKHRQKADEFINNPQPEIDDLIKNGPSQKPSAHTKNEWGKYLSKLISDFLISRDSGAVIKTIVHRSETQQVKTTTQEVIHFQQAKPKNRCKLGA